MIETRNGEKVDKATKGEPVTIPEVRRPTREEVDLTKKEIEDLGKKQEEIDFQRRQVWREYQLKLNSFLGIDHKSDLSIFAERVMEYADANNLNPEAFGPLLVSTIEDTKSIASGVNSGTIPLEGTMGWHYLQAVLVMRRQLMPSMPPEKAFEHLKVIYDTIENESTRDLSEHESCQRAVYKWIIHELFNSEPFWWVVVGK
jgi:hypothetical protein